MQNYIDKLNEYPIIYIDFGNLSVEFKNFVSRQVVKHGFLPLEIKDVESQELNNKIAFIKFEDYDDYLNIYFKNKDYTIPKNIILSEPCNIANLLNLTLSDLNAEATETKALQSIIYSVSSNKIYTTEFLGMPYVVLYDKIDFEIAKNAPVIKDEKALFLWDNYVIYTDGSISDLTFTWKMKLSNTPLDYIVSENRIYILDVTGQVIILNTKSRRTTFTKTFEGAYRIQLDHDGTLLVHTTRGQYTVINEKDVVYKDKRESSSSDNFENFAKFYPSIIDLHITPFGYFYNEIFLGEELKLSYIKNKTIYIVTEVGVWKINLSD